MGVSRKQVVRAFKAKGFFMIEPCAVAVIQEHAAMVDRKADYVVDQIVARLPGQKKEIITGRAVQNILGVEPETDNALMDVDVDLVEESGGNLPREDGLRIVSAFDTPRLVYDSMRKQFHSEKENWPVLGSANDKVDMMIQRYNLVHQRVLRHSLFRPQQLHHDTTQHKLTPIESLLGKASDRSHLLLAMLVNLGSGTGDYVLEDTTGQVSVSFSELQSLDDSSFLTEHAILLVEGDFRDGIFYMHRLAQPLIEPRADTLSLLQKRPPIAKPVSRKFVIVSDLSLEQPQNLSLLENLLEQFADEKNGEVVVCLMGVTTSSSDELKALCKSYEDHERLTIVYVPTVLHGVLPQAPLPETPSTSNPCRIRASSDELVLFHYPVEQVLQQRQVCKNARRDTVATQEDGDTAVRQSFRRMIKTLLNQGHLLPLSEIPIYWNYDHALRLYPLPNVLVLSGGATCESAICETYHGCTVISPGSFSRGGQYTIYDTADESVNFFQLQMETSD